MQTVRASKTTIRCRSRVKGCVVSPMNKFEHVSSDDHQMSLAGRPGLDWGPMSHVCVCVGGGVGGGESMSYVLRVGAGLGVPYLMSERLVPGSAPYSEVQIWVMVTWGPPVDGITDGRTQLKTLLSCNFVGRQY